ncbi:hypothetical protein P8C59_007619 [Phyllachora maydis]|uniref:Secreted protein n=1 Tax=Phyllachora maydis TaxID=1825666 RepID=A0AAD9I9V1_9PEZI|nr:hypothetical protein P8C59_007619 [Phyllachora maydis]
MRRRLLYLLLILALRNLLITISTTNTTTVIITTAATIVITTTATTLLQNPEEQGNAQETLSKVEVPLLGVQHAPPASGDPLTRPDAEGGSERCYLERLRVDAIKDIWRNKLGQGLHDLHSRTNNEKSTLPSKTFPAPASDRMRSGVMECGAGTD